MTQQRIEQIVREVLRQQARRGGQARAKALSPTRRREISRIANAAKRARKGGK